MVMITVVDDMFILCYASTVITVTVLTTVCTEFHGGRKVENDETKIWLGHCKLCHIEVSPRKTSS